MENYKNGMTYHSPNIRRIPKIWAVTQSTVGGANMIGKVVPGTILPIIFAPLIFLLGGAYMIGKVVPGTTLPMIYAPLEVQL